MDRDHFYVDRRASGDLTGDEGRVRLPAQPYGVPIDAGEIYPASLSRPVRLKLHQFLIGDDVTIYLHLWFADGRREGASPVWSLDPAHAANVYFHGPLTFAPCSTSPRLDRGRATKLEVQLGRPGVGEGPFAWRNHSDVPRDVHPLAEIRLPARSDTAAHVVETYRLDQRCCGCRFFRSIELADDVSPGQAEVVVSFPDWVSGVVTPGRFTVTVE